MADTISVDSTATAGVGHIVRIIGAVVDVKFKANSCRVLPVPLELRLSRLRRVFL